MIPQRVSLEGFLCYGDRQEVDLSDLGLCMLSGPNGAGKSSVFDAVTFGLFGAHRGGRQDHADLIHTGRDGAAVEFEFRLDGSAWKVRRIVRRRRPGKSGRPGAVDHQVQLWRWCEKAARWEVVPETAGHREFDNWVAKHLGLTLETFTCSMLLRQGEADRLLSVRPADRFAVLAGVVGLDQYQRLEERASNHCKKARASAETLQSQLDGLPPVADEEIRCADEQAAAARAALDGAAGRVESLHTLHAQAVQWSDLQARLLDARGKHEGHARVVERAMEIEAGWRRLSDLRVVLQPLARVHQQRQRLDESRRMAAALAGQRDQKRHDSKVVAAELQQSTLACDALGRAVEAEQIRERELDRRCAGLGQMLAAAAPYEQHQRDADAVRGEIAALPPQPPADLRRAQEACDEIAAVHAALPALQRLAEHRTAQAATAAALKSNRHALQGHVAEVRESAAGRAEAQRQVEVADAALRSATERHAGAAAAVDTDRKALAAVQQTVGQAQCPACGQPLSDEHRAVEEHRRRGQLELSQAELRDATAQRRSAEAERARSRRALDEAEARCKAADAK
ncbi:MAG TPA: SMC family ATPase, partial [Tepidisphaeraceae bacterium]|nr:SMC family ATPase [Tepidisphaeraceae bacterium]